MIFGLFNSRSIVCMVWTYSLVIILWTRLLLLMFVYLVNYSLTGNLALLVMAPWGSTPRSVVAHIVVVLSPSPVMILRNLFI